VLPVHLKILSRSQQEINILLFRLVMIKRLNQSQSHQWIVCKMLLKTLHLNYPSNLQNVNLQGLIQQSKMLIVQMVYNSQLVTLKNCRQALINSMRARVNVQQSQSLKYAKF
jgi:hypothetical protein